MVCVLRRIDLRDDVNISSFWLGFFPYIGPLDYRTFYTFIFYLALTVDESNWGESMPLSGYI